MPQTESRHDVFHKIIFAANQFFGLLMVVCSIISCSFYAKESKFQLSIENFMYSSSYLNIIVRFVYIIHYRRKSIEEVIEKLDAHFPHHGLEQYSYGVRKYLRHLNAVTWIAIIVYTLACVQFTCFMMEGKLYGWIISQDIPWVPIYFFWFPFNTSSNFVYCGQSHHRSLGLICVPFNIFVRGLAVCEFGYGHSDGIRHFGSESQRD